MKTFRPLPFLLALCCCAGCFNITEEYWFNKDRSGRYELSIDLASMQGLMSMMEQFAPKNDSSGNNSDTPRDTLIHLSTMPDSIKRRLPYPDLLDHASVALQMQDGFKATLALDFQEIGAVARFWENFSALDSLGGAAANDKISFVAGFRNFLVGSQADLSWSGKTFSLRSSAALRPEVEGISMGDDLENPMMKMMFGHSKYRQRFHFAGKVRSVKGKNIRRDGKEATATFPLLDVLSDPTILSCSIRVKR